MTAQLSPLGVQKFYDNNGNPLAFGLLYTYAAGTTNAQASYVDSTQTTQNTNPIQLNFRGECNLWLDPTLTYKLLLTDSAGNTIPNWPVDNVPGGPFITATGSVTVPVSLIPTPTNTFSLGNSTHSWSQLYLGANASPALDTVSGIIGYYPRTAAEITAGITPSDFAYPTWDVRRMGVVGDGTTDDTTALQRCFTVGGEWKIPSGAQVRCTGTITCVKAVRLYSDTSMSPAPPNSVPPTQAFLLHDFNGTFFDLVGNVTDDKIGAGFAFERVTFLQINGNGTGASGTCIRSYGSSGIRCPWLRVSNCNIEQGSGKNDFTWNFDIDGTNAVAPNNDRDIWIEKMRLVSGTNATGCIRLAGVANVYLHNLEANLTKADLLVTGTDGTHLSQNIVITGCSWNNINLDWCQNVYGAGNGVSTVTATANTTDVNLGCDTGAGAPSISSATRTTIRGREAASGKYVTRSTNNVRIEVGTSTPVEISGPLQINTNPAQSGDVRLANAAMIMGRNNANTGDVQIARVATNDRVQIANADNCVLGGTGKAVGFYGTAGNTLQTVSGSRGGNAALASLMTALSNLGLFTDGTTP